MPELVYSYDKRKGLEALLSSCLVTAPGARKIARCLPSPDSFAMIAQWDTGASNCAISRGVVEYLGIVPTGAKVDVKGVNGKFESNVYMVDLLLPEGIVFENLLVTEMKEEDTPLIIIGLNIILQSDFIIEPQGNEVLLKFRYPSEGDKPFTAGPIDLFKKELNP